MKFRVTNAGLGDLMYMEIESEVARSGNRQFPVPEPKNRVVALRRGHPTTKLCQVCGEPIEFNRRTAREWEKVQYCSAVCRRNRHTAKRMPAAS